MLTVEKHKNMWEEAIKLKAKPHYVVQFLDLITMIPLEKVIPSECTRKVIHRTFGNRRGHKSDDYDSIIIDVKDMTPVCYWREL